MLAAGECYVRGLMLEGRRKSFQPMADRLPDGDMQALQQFVSQSPWDWAPVRRRIAERVCGVIRPEMWVVDDVSFAKGGRESVAVARQYFGALGKGPTARWPSACTQPPIPPPARWNGTCSCLRSGWRIMSGGVGPEFLTMSGMRRRASWPWACWTGWLDRRRCNVLVGRSR
jgi:hypothetical protein